MTHHKPTQAHRIIIRIRHMRMMFLLLLIPWICTCAVRLPPICESNGRDYANIGDKIVIYDWDSCYRRGCSYIKGGCLDYAMEQFEMAIADRPRDTNFARTYGMHILGRFPRREREIMGYFPHREMGIIHYKKGSIDEAIKELERSLKECPSSKAMFYLNEARREWLLEKGLDRQSPWIQISYPPSLSYLTNQLTMKLEGKAGDDRYVSSISIDGDFIFIELAENVIPFTYTLSLKEGNNEITITTSDLIGRTTETVLEIRVDTVAPLVNISHSPVESAKKEGWIFIRGITLDDSGVESIRINEVPVDFSGDVMAEFGKWIKVPAFASYIPLAAKDRAGNETLGRINLHAEDGLRRRVGLQRTKGNEGGDTLWHAQLYKPGIIQLASPEPSILALSTPFNLYVEPVPNVTLYNQVYIYGDITYKTPIAEITVWVNGKPLDSLPYSNLLEKIKDRLFRGVVNKLYFGWPIELASGNNEISIKVIDDNGEKGSQTFQVIKKKEDILYLKNRMSVFILDVEDISHTLPGNHENSLLKNPKIDTGAFVELTSAFVEQRRFQILERKKLKEILKEHAISRSILFDKRKAVKIGKLVRADGMFDSYITRTNEYIELKGFMVDVDSTVDLCCSDIYLTKEATGDINTTLSRAAKILAMKIRNHFPLCKGIILEKQRDKIIVNIGSNHKISWYTKLLVYKKNKWFSPILSEAKIEDILDENTSRAELLNKEKEDKVLVNDLVITK